MAVRRAYLGLGSNRGDRLAHLQGAVDALRDVDGLDVVGVSQVYETEPVGGPEQPEYLNAVVAVATDASARELLGLAQSLELAAGRVRGERWGSRTLDVDLLLVGRESIDEPDLTVPHPRMYERAFVLAPLSELAPELVEDADSDWSGVRVAPVALR